MKNLAYYFLLAGSVACTLCTATACSEDTYDADPARDWAGTSTVFDTPEPGTEAQNTYYNPALGRCGDPMPFYDQKVGEFKVLYLQEYENNGANYHPFWGVSTRDCANYTPLNEVLPTGTSNSQQDAVLGTGCAVYNEQDGLYYIYYTGYNVLLSNREVIMRATSSDFRTWHKDPSFLLRGADYGYSMKDFRDPQVFQDDNGVWHMLISTAAGKPVFAEFKSDNLRDWEHVGSFKMVWNDRMCECPDVFKMGNYWYMVFSEAPAWSRQVKYVMANSWESLKTQFDPPKWIGGDEQRSILDTRAFYAGKTASNGTDRYIWGWCPIRTGTTNYERNVSVAADKEPAWAGSLVCHKIIQHSDGTLSLGEVPAIKAKYNQPQPLSIMAGNGYANGTLSGADAYVLFNRLGTNNHVSFTVTTGTKDDSFGISLMRGTDSQKYYTMRVGAEDGGSKHQIKFHEEGPEGKGLVAGVDGYKFDTPANNTYKVDIYNDHSVVVMYINDNVCYTQRIYGIRKNCWSINSYGGTVTISDVRVSQQ